MKHLLLALTFCLSALCGIAHSQNATQVPAETASSPAASAAIELTVVAHPRYFSSYSNPLTRTPAILLRFNSPVDPAELATHAQLIDEDHHSLPIVASRPSAERCEPLQITPPAPTEENPNPTSQAYPLEHFILVQPAVPLPYERSWRLVLPVGFASAHASLNEEFSLQLGSVQRFAAGTTRAISPYDAQRRIDIQLNKRLAKSVTAELAAQLVRVTPSPADLRVSIGSSSITLHGSFGLGRKHQLVLQPGLLAHDRTVTEEIHSVAVTFEAAEPFVSLTAFSTPQLSSGARTFDINAGNLTNLTVQVKKLDDRDLIYALRGYRAYQEDDRSIPFEMVPGPVIYSKSYQAPTDLDRIQSATLDWREILQTASAENSDPATPAALYVSAEGHSRLRGDQRSYGAQSIIQLTDIGLAWKRDVNHDHIYTFSLASGAPLSSVTLQLTDNDAQPLRQITTDAHGLARLPRPSVSSDTENEDSSQTRWLLAKLGDDRYAIALDRLDDTVGLWRFDIPYQYNNRSGNALDLGRRTHVFTDRPVYQPGDEVYLKSHTRLTSSDTLLPASTDSERATTARLRIYDVRHRTLIDTRLAVSEFGSLDHHFTLPDESLGYHLIEIDFNPAEITENSNDHRDDLVTRHHILAAEYRPNTFEITLTPPTDSAPDSALEIPVTARYYMGKPLSKAELNYYAQFTPWQPDARGLEGFRFLHHDSTRPTSFSEVVALGEGGSSLIEIDAPTPGDHPTPLLVTLDTSITDINQQTVARSTQFVVHTSDHYLGLRTPDETGREKQPIAIEFAAVTRDGTPLVERSIPATLTIEKIIHHTVKVKGAGGTITTRNSVRYELVSSTGIDINTAAIDPDTGKVGTTTHSFTPAQAGDYRITIASNEPNSSSAASGIVKVIGESDRDWSWHDDVRLTLTPEKQSYQPGDTARIFLDSAITGHALITLERAHVRHSFTRELTRNRDVIEIPVPEDGAPNLFVSVLVTRGAQDSPHLHPAPAFRLGYTQLAVEDPSRALTIQIDTPQSTYQPAEQIDVTATVRDADGQPLANTEVTLYAVDEGVLSLTGHATPDPNLVLYAPWQLQIDTGQSLGDLHSEDPEELYFNNKGFVIGGGGGEMDDGGSPDRVRKNFQALAFWRGSLITDADGRVSTSFTAPDNLTEYRLIAIAANDDRFASTDTPLTIHKPLIVEPSLPAFANVGDRIDLRAVLHNNTDQPLTLDVRLQLDHTASFPDLGAPNYIPTGLGSAEATPADTSSTRTRRIELGARETTALTFPVDFKNVGVARWQWSAVSLEQADGQTLNDRVESSLDIGYPLPLLRESHHTSISIDPSDPDADILQKISPELLRGRGHIRVTASNSRLLEAADALDYLLKYPYGCVEQTTSSTLPWLSTQNLREALPGLQKTDAEITAAIDRGTRRLLSMQTHDGGLGYWPGAEEPVLWGSAYGGMALALAQRSGMVDLPAESLDALWTYLSENLRNTGNLKTAYELSQRSLALYTLALAGRAEPAYHDHLYQRRDELPDEARALLALAILESSKDAPAPKVDARALALLEKNPSAPDSAVTWYGSAYTHATQLLARTMIDPAGPATDQVITDLLALRKPLHGWGSTYQNAWPLLALTAHARATLTDLSSAEVEIHFAGETHTLPLADHASSATLDLPFDGDLSGYSLTLSKNADSPTPLHAHIEVETLPDLATAEAINKDGFSISRSYRKIAPDGSLSPADQLTVGDLVLITLDLTVPEKQHYLAIDDPLPAIFEAINPAFESQANQSVPQTDDLRTRLYTHYRELRKDRALFFCDYVYRAGDYQLQYLARVSASGEATAPAAKIEAMYSPQSYALTATRRITALPLVPDADTEQKARAKVATR